jgi:O-antigen ligase
MIAFYLLVAIMPLVRHSLWSQTKIGGLTLNKYLGVACLLVALLHLASRNRRPRFFATLQSRVFVVFGVATMVSFALFGPSTIAVEASPIGNWASFLLLFFTTAVLVDSLHKLRLVLLSLIGGVAFASSHLIREWIGWGATAGARPGWVTGDANYFALCALLCMPLGLLMALQRRPLWERLFCWSCFAITLLAFTLAGSRGGFLGLLVSFAVVAWHSRHRVRLFTIGLLVLGVLVIGAPTSPLTRLLDPGRPDLESTRVRMALLWAGLSMFEQHMLTGIGVGNFKGLVGTYAIHGEQLHNVAHNTYLEVAAELGVFGLIAFLAIIFASISTLRRLRRQTDHGRAPLLYVAAHGLEAGLLGGAVALVFLSALPVRIMWFVIIVSMCLPGLAATVARRGAHPEVKRPRQATLTAELERKVTER